MREQDGFAEFVSARSPALLRSAWLLTGDWSQAQDLVQESLAKAWRRWDGLLRRDNPEVYVRKVMVNTHISWSRRRWHGEKPTETLPDVSGLDEGARADLSLDMTRALQTLPARQRAVLVLRYFDDLTEAQAADLLGCSVGTVKSSASKAIRKLRECPGLAFSAVEEGSR
jgi:RNA polymerase sigma-70 factor (sigma-E family)